MCGRTAREDDEREQQEDECAAEPAQTLGSRLDGGFGVHRVCTTTKGELAKNIDAHRDQKQNGCERVGLSGIRDLLESVEDLYGGHFLIVEHQRCAEFGEGPDEDDRGTGKQTGSDERKNDLSQPLPGCGAEIFRRFVQSRIEIGQCRNRVEIQDGIQVQRFDKDDGPEAAGADEIDTFGDESKINQQGIERARFAQEMLQSDGADKGRQDEWDENECVEKTLAPEFVSNRTDRQWYADQQADDRRADGDAERIQKTTQGDRVTKHVQHVIEREPAVRSFETGCDDQPDRPREEDPEPGEQENHQKPWDKPRSTHGPDCRDWMASTGSAGMIA